MSSPRFLNHLLNRVRRSVLNWLMAPDLEYAQLIYNNLDHLYRYIRKGDVVLVEGRTRLSRVIKLFSLSHWSHMAMYVGDELVRRGAPEREKYLAEFGEDAHHMVVEALSDPGVVASPLRKYIEHNIRICRPYGIRRQHLRQVVASVAAHIGKQYDQQNIIDLALMSLPDWVNPLPRRTHLARLGSQDEFKVICSGMIARAFHEVGYPVLPVLEARGSASHRFHEQPYGPGLVMRHYTQIKPRDFDLSPNFEIIKFNIIKPGRFNYHVLASADSPDKTPATVDETIRPDDRIKRSETQNAE